MIKLVATCYTLCEISQKMFGTFRIEHTFFLKTQWLFFIKFNIFHFFLFVFFLLIIFSKKSHQIKKKNKSIQIVKCDKYFQI